MDKILLVGGNGYLGKHLREALENKYDIYYTGRTNKDSEKYYCIDFQDQDTFENLKSFFFDYIFVLSADFSGLGKLNLDKKHLDVNTTMYASFLNFLSHNKSCNKIVFISSMTVYSDTNKSPVSEESCTKNPPNVYGLSKLIGERLTEFYCHKNDVKGLVFRLPGLFGGNRKAGYIYHAIEKLSQNEKLEINTKGLVYWECVSVSDIANMIDSFLENYKWEIPFSTYNLCYGEEVDIVKIAYTIKTKLNSSSEITEISEKGYSKFYLDNVKAKKVIPIDSNIDDSLSSYIKQITN